MIAQDPQHQSAPDPSEDLTAMLRAGASGHVPTEAAVGLLIGHGGWPQRLSRDGHVDTWPSGDDGPAMAAIHWQAVADRIEGPPEEGFAASSSEHAILALATSLTGRLKVCLGDLLPRLDATNAGLAATAVAHACNSGIHVTAHRPRATNGFDVLLSLTRRAAALPSNDNSDRRLRP